MAKMPTTIQEVVDFANKAFVKRPEEPLYKQELQFYYEDSEGEEIVVSEDEDLEDVSFFTRLHQGHPFKFTMRVLNPDRLGAPIGASMSVGASEYAPVVQSGIQFSKLEKKPQRLPNKLKAFISTAVRNRF